MHIPAVLRKIARLRPDRIGLFRYSDPNHLNLHFASGSRLSLTEWQGLHAYYKTDHLRAGDFDEVYANAIGMNPNLVRDILRLRTFNVLKFGEIALKSSGDVLFAGLSFGVVPHAFLQQHSAALKGRKVWIADPLDATLTRSARTKTAAYRADFEKVKRVLSAFADVRVVKGYIPDVLGQVDAASICFAHMDTTDPVSEVGSFPWIKERMKPGGVMIVDAFGTRHEGTEQYAPILDSLGFTTVPLMNGQAACFA